jgi:UDP-N-acetyl-D-mannosaminuronate dehydrogenase
MPPTFAVIGLGYVGLPLAVEVGKQRLSSAMTSTLRAVQSVLKGRHRPFVSLARPTMSSTI